MQYILHIRCFESELVVRVIISQPLKVLIVIGSIIILRTLEYNIILPFGVSATWVMFQ